MSAVLLPGAILGYTLAIALATAVTVYRARWARHAASVLFGLTWLLHFSAVVRQAWVVGGLPLTDLGEFLLVLGWAVLTLHLWVWFRLRMDVAGLLLPPIALLATVAAQQLLSAHAATVAAHQDAWFVFHTTVSTLGLATLCVAFAMSVIYLIQDRALKAQRRLQLLERLPALEKCDRVGYHALLMGFLLFTVGIFTGAMIQYTLRGNVLSLGAKPAFPILAWMVFACVLASRTLLGFRGRKSAYMTIAGFALGMLTLLGLAV